MAAKWISTYKGRPLPQGVRIRRSGKGDRLYIRIMVAGGGQKDIGTQWYAHERGAISLAHNEYLRRKIERDTGPVRPASEAPETREPCSLRAVLAAEFAYYQKRPRRRNELSLFAASAARWEDYLGADRDVHTIKPTDITDFIAARRSKLWHGRRTSYGTIFRDIMRLRGAIRRAQRNGHVAIGWSVEWPRLTDYPKDPVHMQNKALARSKEEVERFLAAAPRSLVRLFEFSRRTGLRAEELERINIGHFDPPNHVWVTTKERRPGPWHCPLTPYCVAIIEEILAERPGADPSESLFMAGVPEGKQKDYAYIYPTRQTNNKLGLKGQQRIKLRDMRATAGRAVYDMNKDIDAARRFLRHSTIEMTRRYLDLAEEQAPVNLDVLF